MQLTLTIAPNDQAQRETVAWFVCGRDANTWVAELICWNVPLESLVLRVIPGSQHDFAPIGVLVTVDQRGGSLPDVRRLGSLATPYRCLANRLFVPVDSDFVPVVSDEEIARLLPVGDATFIWHPSAGLVRYEQVDLGRVTDLIQPPREKPSRWDRAVTGLSFQSRLLSIEPAAQPTVEEILKNAGGEIGIDSSLLKDLPPNPGEGLTGKIHDWIKPLRNAWKSLWKRQPSKPDEQRPATGSAAGSKGPAGQGTGLGGFLGQAFASVFGIAAGAASLVGRAIPQSFIDHAARLREIDRLMHLLKSDPDAGLRFALPMRGDAAPRGIAPPSNRLGQRDINFGLGKLFASGAVDPWDVPPQQQIQLTQMYRELAIREVRLGRHRRAAYIYAELLGDLRSAATTLESGKHYREAAVLYRDRLSSPQHAARCLELGGFLDEAAQLYVELGLFEQAADLYVRLERSDEAERLLRKWAEQLTLQHHFVHASEVLHRKLNDVDAALLVLDQGWNQGGPVAPQCLDRHFSLLAEFSRHDTARQRVTMLRDSNDDSRIYAVAQVLSTVARNYVDRAIRDDASDATRIVVSRRLPVASPSESAQLLTWIRSLAPQDRLLSRDCDRFVKQREDASRKPLQKTPRQANPTISMVHSFSLAEKIRPEGTKIHWHTAKSTDAALYAVGHDDWGLVLVRTPWANPLVKNVFVGWSNVSSGRRILLELITGSKPEVYIHAVGSEPLSPRVLSLGFGGPGEAAGSPSWASASTVAFACGSGVPQSWRVRSTLGQLELTGFNPRGDVVTSGTFSISIPQEELATLPISICASVAPVRIGVANLICRPVFNDASDRYIALDSEIQSLDNHLEGKVNCVVALFDVGGAMICEPIQENRPQPFGEGIESPCGTFLHGGRYVIAGTKECRVYRFDEGYPKEVCQRPLDSPAVAVVRTDTIGQFAVVAIDGGVHVFSLT